MKSFQLAIVLCLLLVAHSLPGLAQQAPATSDTPEINNAQPTLNNTIPAVGSTEPQTVTESQKTSSVAGETVFDNLSLQYAKATNTAELLQRLFEPDSIIVTADSRTNEIFVRGPRDTLLMIAEIVRKLDRPSTNPTEIPESANSSRNSSEDTRSTKSKTGVTNAGAARTQELRQDYEAKEKQAAATARQLRQLSQGSDRQSAKANDLQLRLRREVAEAFAARQELHQAEIASLQQRIEGIQQTIVQRNDIQDQIIERRVADLLNPNLRWDADTKSTSTQSDRSPTSGTSTTTSTSSDAPSIKSFDTSMPGGSQSLSDAVRHFNRVHAKHPIGKDQPPLTDDEVVAAIRWSVTTNRSRKLSVVDARVLEKIAETRRLPTDATFNAFTDFNELDGSQVQKWTIMLTLHRANETDYHHLLREQFVRWKPPVGILPDIDPNIKDQKGTPLAAAINGFNLQHQSDAISKEQPPLTEDEVIAAIHWWKTKRNEADLTNEEFDAFQAIASTRMLPEKVEFEVLTSFRPNEQFEFDAWSVRIVMPRIAKSGWTYAFTIRDRWINSRSLDERPISWGPPAANGIQAGISFTPQAEEYATGQKIVPHFFYRNTGNKKMSVAFPRIMTHGYYKSIRVVDSAGQDIEVYQDPSPAGPVGWIQMPLGPNAQHEIVGQAVGIRVKNDPFDGDYALIRAEPGQSCRMWYTVPNYGDPDAGALETGEVRFTVAPAPSQSQ